MASRSVPSYLDLVDDLVIALGADLTVSDWNEPVASATGLEPERLAGTDPDSLFATQGDQSIAAVAGDPTTGRTTLEADLVTGDGATRSYEVTVVRGATEAVEDVDAAGAVLVARERRREQPQHETVHRRERALHQMHAIIADADRSVEAKVRALLALGRRELDTEYGTLSRIEGDDYVFEVVDTEDDAIEGGDVVPLEATNCELAAGTEQTLVLGDVARDAPEQTDRAGYAEWGISCYIGAPVTVDGEVYGTFCFYGTEPREGQFSDWEVTLVDLMAQWVEYEYTQARTQERLREHNERLEQFASFVSHDLRSPLSVVDGSLDLTRETGDLTHLDRADRAVERMDSLIDDLLTLARSGDGIGEREAVDLADLVGTCWDTLDTEGATIAIESDRTVRADRGRLRQLFENLLRNSLLHAGPAVTVTVGDLPDGFFVADDGPGVPTADREQVFEKGYSTDREGTGFGLAIVREVANAHGWDVALAESETGGARFEITGVAFAD